MSRYRRASRMSAILLVALTMLLVGASGAVAQTEPLSVDATIDPTGTVDRTGLVTVSGTITCTGSPNWGGGDGTLVQIKGNRQAIQGFWINLPGECTGEPAPWTATFRSWGNVPFRQGLAAIDLTVWVEVEECWYDEELDEWFCDYDYDQMSTSGRVQLRLVR